MEKYEQLKLYDSLSKREKCIEISENGKVSVYFCGPTVYDHCHIGHGRMLINSDLLFRTLKNFYKDVIFVMNITDVDDKIIKKAEESNKPYLEVAQEFYESFQESKKILNILEPTFQPRASEYIDEMIKIIEKIIEKGHAYVNSSGVYFDTDSIDYGFFEKKEKNIQRIIHEDGKKRESDFALWKTSCHEVSCNEHSSERNRIESNLISLSEPKSEQNKTEYKKVSFNEHSSDSNRIKLSEDFIVQDFIVIDEPNKNEKSFKTFAGEQSAVSLHYLPKESCNKIHNEKYTFNSPWGKGRPGWHIECSAMSQKLLGTTFQIHGGGCDLRFPHHENEIAQSIGAFGVNPAEIWLHSNMINFDGEKMSKSLKNFVYLKDFVQNLFTGDLFRYCVLSYHYSSQIEFSENLVNQSKNTLEKIRVFYFKEIYKKDIVPDNNYINPLLDNLNSPKALSLLHDFMKNFEKGKFIHLLTILGFKMEKKSILEPQEILNIIENRNLARLSKNIPLSDSLRKKLEENFIGIEDSKEGTLWFYR